jgi:hypothetical protein
LELTAAAAAAAAAVPPSPARTRGLERDSSSNSLPKTPRSGANAIKARSSPSPFASLWSWALPSVAAATPQPVGGSTGAGHSSGQHSQPDVIDTSSSNSSGGDDDGGLRRRQLLQQDAEKGGRGSPGLLGALRTGVWCNAVQGLGHKGSRSKQGRDQNDRSAHLSRRRRSSLMYGVMVIDMGVHQLSGLVQKVNLTQVGLGGWVGGWGGMYVAAVWVGGVGRWDEFGGGGVEGGGEVDWQGYIKHFGRDCA